MSTTDQTTTRAIHTSRLSDHERQMLRFAQTPLTPGERRELLWYLDASELPSSAERVKMVVERILGGRATTTGAPSQAEATTVVEWGFRDENGAIDTTSSEARARRVASDRGWELVSRTVTTSEWRAAE